MLATMKTCSKCKVDKELSDFHKRHRSSDGLMAQCKECVNSRIRDAYKRDPKAKIAKTRQYHLDNPEWSKNTLREWHAKNRDVRNARVKERLANDPEFLAYRRALVARKERERRAQKAGTEYTKISKEEYDTILKQYDNCCWICEDQLETVYWDHHQPLAKGGAHVVSNLRPSCNPCNTRKNATWPFTTEMKNRIADEVRALRTPQSPIGSVTDGMEVTDVCH